MDENEVKTEKSNGRTYTRESRWNEHVLQKRLLEERDDWGNFVIR
jgi:hypothetical protein